MDAKHDNKRNGPARLWHALRFSLAGLRAAWHEPAFRQECWGAAILLPAAPVIGNGWLETVVLVGLLVAVLVVELLNTAVESVVDRVGTEWHELSKRAKDTGSAAVLLALLLCAVVWLTAVWRWLVA